MNLKSTRKELKEQYKEMKPQMGVFVVQNRRTQQCFLESSNDIQSMFNRIRFQLEMGMHPCKGLQADWKQSGGSEIDFVILDTLPHKEGSSDSDYAAELQTLKTLWLEKLSQDKQLVLY